ncbi:MAG TPA: HIT family protein [Thermomicrobiales bacterium]|nr:HIT family protein [Thermomicrobiales bacterium]
MTVVSHAPADYVCPFCAIVQGSDLGPLGTTQDDIVYRGDGVVVFVASTWWPNNPGHVLVIPEAHYENLYDIPSSLGTPMLEATRLAAIAMKIAYGCDGITTRQSNEPAGNQDVWHLHTHVYPRYDDDQIFRTSGRPTTADERVPYAAKMRAAIDAVLAEGVVA